MSDGISETINRLNKAMVGVDVSLAMPALTGYLAQIGAIYGYDQEEFKAFINNAVTSTYEEYNQRVQN